MSNIFICGNFGYRKDHRDGQTVKTRELKEELIREWSSKNVEYADTSYVKVRPFRTIYAIIRGVKKNKNTILMPDKMALTVILPIVINLNRFWDRDIRYVVIGGWLPNFLKENSYYLKLISELDGVYVETLEMKDNLNELNLSNVYLMPNFRRFDFSPPNPIVSKGPLRLVTFSRVLKEKGIELSIESVSEINKKSKKPTVILDIYGPIQNGYEDIFSEIMGKQDEYIQYKGILEKDEIYSTLSNYDLLLFPTFFESEGFPGTIIDAYISGLPVIASNWAYNQEFVEDGVTGKICKAMDRDDLVSNINYLLNNKKLILEYKKNARDKAEDYHADNIVGTLINHIKN